MLFGRSLFVTSFVHWLSHSSIRLFIARLFQQAFQSLIFPLVRPFIYPSIGSSICVFIHQSADPSIHPFIRPLIHPSLSIRSSIPLSIQPLTHHLTHPPIGPFVRQSVRPFIISPIHPRHLFIPLFSHSFSPSFPPSVVSGFVPSDLSFLRLSFILSTQAENFSLGRRQSVYTRVSQVSCVYRCILYPPIDPSIIRSSFLPSFQPSV